MRSILPVAICIACLIAITYPAFAKGEQKSAHTKPHVSQCIRDKNGVCRKKPVIRGTLYQLGLPKKNRDGRTHRRIQIK
ncbi:hypothetical protein [uncultured Cohaesibacter sp.]|uniref:hypothetical protein n=1 Tax=uncultured Cohaesibacter sp. TaxID=1002546 RepID=UPI0029C83447|nr:hypothetical protein [uncultured Cohaesibacter sp.]